MSGRHRRAGGPIDVPSDFAPEDLEAADLADVASHQLTVSDVALGGVAVAVAPVVAAPSAPPVEAEPEAVRVPPAPPVSAPPVIAVPVAPAPPSAPAPQAPVHSAPPVAGAGAAVQSPMIVPSSGGLPGGATFAPDVSLDDDATGTDPSNGDGGLPPRRPRWTRRTMLVTGAVVLALLALVGIKILSGRSLAPAGPAPAAAARPQSTLVIQVLDGSGRAAGTALLGHDAKGAGGVGLLIPSSLVVNVAGVGSSSIADAASISSEEGTAVAVGDTLGVLVDGTWTLTPAAFGALVDSVGGVSVTVDRDVTVPGAGTGTVVLVPSGAAKLNGVRATAFAEFLAPGEPESARLARFSQVLLGVLGALPAGPDQVGKVISGLGAGSTGTQKPDQLAVVVDGLRADQGQPGGIFVQDLPTHGLDTGSASPTLVLDTAAASAIIADKFAGSVPPKRAGGPVRVLVQNGVGTPGLNLVARTKLIAAGLTFVSGGNAPSFGHATTQILVRDDTTQSQDEGNAVAQALGLPQSDILVTSQGTTLADVVVVLGADFKS
jgi:hypothetical protein